MFLSFCFLVYNGSHSQKTTSRYNRTIQNLDYQSIVYITDKCEYVSVQNQQNVVLRVCGNNYLLPFFFFSFFFCFWDVYGCLKACVCVINTVYLVFKMEKQTNVLILIFFFFLSIYFFVVGIPATFPVGVEIALYVRMV